MVQKTSKKSSTQGMQACYDREHKSCIQVERSANLVKFIPLALTGLEVGELPMAEFDRRYLPAEQYPIERACRLYVGYAQDLGATTEALAHLGRVIKITQSEIDMATKKKAAKPAKAATTKKTNGAAKRDAATGERKPTAAQLFKDLIMEGGLTDDQIFKKVQTKFGLSDDKRSYVKWYRNALVKEGKKVPKQKEA